MMRFRFDSKQEHQVRAVESVVGLFEGAPRQVVDLSFTLGSALAVVPNAVILDEQALLANLRAVQAATGLPQDPALELIEAEVDGQAGPLPVRFPNFSVEMETGTGKTYVYLRTVLQLYRRYGLRKFIVVVPSVAIREGVLKTLRITDDHFKELYGQPPYRYYPYDSSNIAQARQFALAAGIELLVMTIDSFNKASNVIRQPSEALHDDTPIHLIQATR